MHQINKVLSQIKHRDWNPLLADVHNNWKWEKLPKQSASPTCVFTIRARCILDGYDQIFAEWNVDEKDLQRKEIVGLSDPESAYMQFVQAHFSDFMVDVKMKLARHAAKLAGITLPKGNGPIIQDSKHQRQMNDFKNLMHEHRQRKKRWEN